MKTKLDTPLLAGIGVIVIAMAALAGYEIWYGQHAKALVDTPAAAAQQQSSPTAPEPAEMIESTWTDPATGLTWTKADSGSAVSWQQAIDYCKDLQLAGHSDWRLATIDELHGIYDPKANVQGYWGGGHSPVTNHVKGDLKLSGFEWSSSPGPFNADLFDRPFGAWFLEFGKGTRDEYPFGVNNINCALCVRGSEK